MAKQHINIGSAPNDGSGDTLRDAMDKCNDNFTELYGRMAEVTFSDVTANKQLPDAVPAGYILEYIVLRNKDLTNACVVNIGTTSTGKEIFEKVTVPANDTKVLDVKGVYSYSAAKTLYINDSDGADFNGATLDVYFKNLKI